MSLMTTMARIEVTLVMLTTTISHMTFMMMLLATSLEMMVMYTATGMMMLATMRTML